MHALADVNTNVYAPEQLSKAALKDRIGLEATPLRRLSTLNKTYMFSQPTALAAEHLRLFSSGARTSCLLTFLRKNVQSLL